jgi:hypothetical protein
MTDTGGGGGGGAGAPLRICPYISWTSARAGGPVRAGLLFACEPDTKSLRAAGALLSKTVVDAVHFYSCRC